MTSKYYREEKYDKSFSSSISSGSMTIPSSSSSPNIISKDLTIISKTEVPNTSFSENLNNSILDNDSRSILSSSISSIKNLSQEIVKKFDGEEEDDEEEEEIKKEKKEKEKEKNKKVKHILPFSPSSSLLSLLQQNNQQPTPSTPSIKESYSTKDETKNEKNNKKLTLIPVKKERTKDMNLTKNEEDQRKNNNLEKKENGKQEPSFIKSFIDCTLDEYGTCSSMEREVIEKLLMRQVPLLKNYENIINNIETFIEKIIIDMSKNKSREHNELKKSDIIIADFNQKYHDLKEYSNDIKKMNKDLSMEIGKYKKYIKQIHESSNKDKNKNDIKKITNSTTNTIKKAILIYEYLFKENLKFDNYHQINDNNNNNNKEDDEMKKLKHIYKSITKKFQTSLEKEINKISDIRERYHEKVEEQKQELFRIQKKEQEKITERNQQFLKEQQQEQQEQLQKVIEHLKQEINEIQNSKPKKWTEMEFLTKLEDTMKEYNKVDDSCKNIISYELKLLEKTYYIISSDVKNDLERLYRYMSVYQNCIVFLNSVNESENVQNINSIFPSIKQLYQEVKSLNRILKIKDDIYKNDKYDDQQTINNNITSINELKEELTQTRNSLVETEQKYNQLMDENNKISKELESTTSQVESLENNIYNKKKDLKEFLSEHNTLVELYNTVVDEERKKYEMLEDDYNFLKLNYEEFQKRINFLEQENHSLQYKLSSFKRNSTLKRHNKYNICNL
ncbi:hypothetical protein BCR32DRAFT_267559 [Anaeromyces robustus]|uniref:Uncharacterized protein n=1 Tax=Anaeromyces robustus TaxID=1754192 RepID=A0A1Y1X9U5_9FUNG|nr:hypothetical protein BCR32DRAFT_267559 [Anaeromyces robustus]|eukprot:ORX82551.1 hypothetical protein BCR32DRAFT_267559 [Anaeromyces robustus]